MWDIQSGTKLVAIRMGPEKLPDCDFTPDGKKLVVLGRRDNIWIYDIASLDEIDGHPLTIAALQRRAQTLFQDEKLIAAEATFRRILQLQSKSLPPGHPDLTSTRERISASLTKQGKPPP